MTKKETLTIMKIEPTDKILAKSKFWLERFFNYYMEQPEEHKEIARRFILQFMPR